MLESGNRDRGSLNFAVRGSELLDGSETATAELAGHGISASNISIYHADQAHSLPLLRKLLVNAGMVAAERAYTDDRNVYKILKIHRHAPSGIAGLNHKGAAGIPNQDSCFESTACIFSGVRSGLHGKAHAARCR